MAVFFTNCVGKHISNISYPNSFQASMRELKLEEIRVYLVAIIGIEGWWCCVE